MLNMTPFDAGVLRRFQVPEDWEQQQGNDCLDWPCLLVSADQGPDSWCAQAWLESPCHGWLNMVRELDARNHGVHNHTLGAVMDIGFGSLLYSATVALNIHFFPWNDGALGRKIIQAADTFGKFSSSSHLVFQHVAEVIGSREELVWTSDCIRQLRTHCLESVSGVRVFPNERAESWQSCLCEGFLMTGQACL